MQHLTCTCIPAVAPCLDYKMLLFFILIVERPDSLDTSQPCRSLTSSDQLLLAVPWSRLLGLGDVSPWFKCIAPQLGLFLNVLD